MGTFDLVVFLLHILRKGRSSFKGPNTAVKMVYSTTVQSKFAHKVGEPVPEFNTDHPAHPAIVHFPIAFNTLAWGLDILYALTTIWVKPAFLTSRFGSASTLVDITRLSYFLLCAGLITTVPAIMSGNKQLIVIISMVLLPFLLMSAKIGGTLVFNHGVGLNLGRK